MKYNYTYMCVCILIINLFGLHCTQTDDKHNCDVEITNRGKTVKGEHEYFYITEGFGEVCKYLGIRYANPSKRFVPPKEVDNKHFTTKATSLRASCYQPERKDLGSLNVYEQMWTHRTWGQEEDCLFLNIWTPETYKKENLPVMVWIHGDRFLNGTAHAPMFEGKYLASTQNVIVINLQYRMGPLGFIYLDPFLGSDANFKSGELPKPNLGLLDQQMALNWIQENIKYFGGDPHSVTLFGQSAGAASISYHLMMPESRKQFKRIILQSGSSYAGWAADDPKTATKKTYKLLKEMNCHRHIGYTDRLLNCVKGWPLPHIYRRLNLVLNDVKINRSAILTNYTKQYDTKGPVSSSQLYYDSVFKPIFEPTQIGDNVSQIIEEKDVMFGVNAKDAELFVQYGVQIGRTKYSLSQKKHFMYDDSARDYLNRPNVYWLITAQMLPEKFITGGCTQKPGRHFNMTQTICDEESTLKKLTRIGTGLDFACPIICAVKEHTGKNVYAYLFNKHRQNDAFGLFKQPLHGTEVQYVFGLPFSKQYERYYEQDDRELSYAMMKYWANFARTGDPNYEKGINWPLYKPHGDYLLLPNKVPSTGDIDLTGDCNYWKDLNEGCTNKSV